jgi:hypothetical protein
MTAITETPTRALEQLSSITGRIRKPYPNYKVIVLDDDINTFQHVTECLLKYIPVTRGPATRWKREMGLERRGRAIDDAASSRIPVGCSAWRRLGLLHPSAPNRVRPGREQR